MFIRSFVPVSLPLGTFGETPLVHHIDLDCAPDAVQKLRHEVSCWEPSISNLQVSKVEKEKEKEKEKGRKRRRRGEGEGEGAWEEGEGEGDCKIMRGG
jgi:hypothetical protein